jgi:hypothetical protein
MFVFFLFYIFPYPNINMIFEDSEEIDSESFTSDHIYLLL